MTGLEALQYVQFVTIHGLRFAMLPAEDWNVLMEWLETIEDAQIAREALADLKTAAHDRDSAGWLRWDEATIG